MTNESLFISANVHVKSNHNECEYYVLDIVYVHLISRVRDIHLQWVGMLDLFIFDNTLMQWNFIPSSFAISHEELVTVMSRLLN